MPQAEDNSNRRTKPTPAEIEGRHGWMLRSAIADAADPASPRVWPSSKKALPPWDEWYAITKDLGGTREEYDRLLEDEQRKRTWPTPAVPTGGQRIPKDAVKVGNSFYTPDGQKVQQHLGEAVKMYRTPDVGDWRSGMANRADGTRGNQVRLADQVVAKMYPTPRESEYKGSGPLGSKSQEHMPGRGYLCATIQDDEKQTGQLNPAWVEFLMGWPRGWSAPEPVSQAACDAALSGHLWDFDPADLPTDDPGYIPRLSSEDKPARRRARLQALGNGWVPQAAAVVLCAIRDAVARAQTRMELSA